MRRLRGIGGFILALTLVWGTALADSFDIFDYTAPQGWKKNALEGGVMLSLQTQTSLGSIILYASVPAGPNAEQNFRGEWKRLVSGPLGIAEEPQLETGPKAGDYANVAGGASGSADGTNYVVLLSTFSGNGRVASVLYITTEEQHLEVFDSFNSALKLTKPKAVAAPPPAAQNPSAPSSTRTISTPTTKFDNGWTATVQNGFVRVVKGEVMVLIHYGLALPEGMWVYGNEKERVNYYWGRLVAGRYRADGVKVFENGVCYTCLYFGESSATEVSSGARKHVALFISFEKGQGYAIQAVASDFQTFQKEFPDIEALGKMAGYNKFAVKPADLVGTWDESSSSALNYYNNVTGAYAGMNAVSGSDEFTFNRDGTYSSKHAGAYGFVGSQTFYNYNYRGRMTVTDWRITLTNRFGGKNESYDAYFQMTSAGPILRLAQVGASSITYDLGLKK